MKKSYPVDWSATPIHPALALIGDALAEQRLRPGIIANVLAIVSCIPDHVTLVQHTSGKDLGRRKGYYEITIEGPRLGGSWRFSSGELEQISRNVAQKRKQSGLNSVHVPSAMRREDVMSQDFD